MDDYTYEVPTTLFGLPFIVGNRLKETDGIISFIDPKLQFIKIEGVFSDRNLCEPVYAPDGSMLTRYCDQCGSDTCHLPGCEMRMPKAPAFEVEILEDE